MLRFGVVAAVLTVMMGMGAASDGEGIAGHRFVLSAVNGEPLATEREIAVDIDADFRLTGQICNAFNGQAEFRDGILRAEHIASTRMLCPDRELSELEAVLLGALRDGVAAMRIGETLELRRGAWTWRFRLADAAPSSEEEGVGARRLSGRKFVLREVDGEAFAAEAGRQPFIEFGNPETGLRVTGSACNNFMGEGRLDGGVLTLDNAASTMMLCVDPKLSDFERDFHQALREGVAVELSGDTLTLRGDGKTFTYVEEDIS